MEPEKAKELLESDEYYLLDVRSQDEWNNGHIPGAQHFKFGTLEDHIEEIPKDKTLLAHCAVWGAVRYCCQPSAGQWL
ncbi:rhodanese-like domain-containing protein [Cytobacillus oceanisediminis]|uniref:rhodanese-like domain-containing protein n=1 Tax=Cytobacillus oceanisediminis TaxID=665099 RepID=UPI003736CB1E